MTDRHDTPSVNPSPIPTEYAGHQFRSRLEARWAVFFDYARLEWHYEVEGYELPSGRYLPDFYLPQINGGSWFEVKGQQPTDRERQLAFELAEATGQEVFIAWGQIPASFDPSTGEWPQTFDIEVLSGGWDNYRRFCTCHVCGKPGLQFCGRDERNCPHGGGADHYSWADTRWTAANYLARTYQFWSPK